MEATDDRPSYYFDGEWLHFKSVGEYERSEGGWAVNSKGVNVTYEGSEHTRCNKHTGCQVGGIFQRISDQYLN